MSEHNLFTTRYWARREPDGSTVYFTTASNAAHARAESDPRAEETTRDEYESNVPAEAREQPYNATQQVPAGKVNGTPRSPQPPGVESGDVEEFKARSLSHMIAAHQQVVHSLLSAPITHAERIFVLEMAKHELLQSMMQVSTQVPTQH